jgi:hypothetical protein
MRWPKIRRPVAKRPDTGRPPRLGEPFSIAFAGGMYAWPYYCGVASVLQQNDLVHPDARLWGTSSGNVAALGLVLGHDLERDTMLRTMASNDEHNHRLLGPYLHPRLTQQSFFGSFGALLGDDAHEKASDRLHVVVSRLRARGVERRIVSRFQSREALLHTVAASMAIPGHGVHLAFDARPHGHGWCLDGGLAGGSCESDEREGWGTLRVAVSPWLVSLVARVDLCPSRPLGWRELLTIQSLEARRALFDMGRRDTDAFIARAA